MPGHRVVAGVVIPPEKSIPIQESHPRPQHAPWPGKGAQGHGNGRRRRVGGTAVTNHHGGHERLLGGVIPGAIGGWGAHDAVLAITARHPLRAGSTQAAIPVVHQFQHLTHHSTL